MSDFNLSERDKAAFQAASDLAKQVLTLTAGVLALSITFSTDLASGATGLARWMLGASWVILALSIIPGIMTLMAIAGSLGRCEDQELDLYSANIRIPSGVHLAAFVAGVVLLSLAAAATL